MKYLLAIAALLLITSDALACSCIPMTREETIAKSALVVRGMVADAETDKMAHPDFMLIARFKIIERIKGDAPDIITVATAKDSAACGIKLPKDTVLELALYEGEDGIYRASLCSQLGLNAKPH